MNVSIVIINYKTYQLTADCINSILKYTQGITYEIIVVDNASCDGSAERLKADFGGKITLIESDKNSGTSKGFNMGAKKASGEYILWLNSDTQLIENFVYKLYDYAKNHTEIGILGGNILDFNYKPMHSYRLEMPRAKTIKRDYSFINYFKRIFRKPKALEYNHSGKPMEVGYITGADMMINRKCFEDAGYFDEDIFMYAEEVEFTCRVKNAGYKVVSYPEAKILHLEGASFSHKKAEYSDWHFRTNLNGNKVYIIKTYGKEEWKKYLKNLKTGLLKQATLYAVMLKFDMVKVNKQKRKTVTEYIAEI